jgi:hypothetical protein
MKARLTRGFRTVKGWRTTPIDATSIHRSGSLAPQRIQVRFAPSGFAIDISSIDNGAGEIQRGRLA